MDSIPGSLSLAEATPAQRRAMAIGCLTYCLLVAVLLPYATRELPPMPQITGVYATAVFVADICTFVLLAAEFTSGRASWLVVLACAYLYSGLMALLHLLSFPGALIGDVPVIGDMQTVAWLYAAWSLGFVTLIFASVLTHVWAPVQLRSGLRADAVLSIAVVTVLGAVAVLVALATAGPGVLPPLLSGDRFSALSVFMNAGRGLIALTALAVLWSSKRGRITMIHLWVCLALVAAAAGPLLTDLGGRRYTFGWYAGRASFVFASSVVLVGLLAEFVRLQHVTAGALTRLKAQTESLSGEIERRELAERKLIQAQKMEAIGRLAGGVAHDFNNLLTIVVANLELILRTSSSERTGQLAEKAIEVALRGGRLTRSLLAFGQQQPLRAEVVDTAQLIKRFRMLIERAVGEAIELRTRASTTVWPCLADPDQLEVALLNLAFNARDAMPKGGVIYIETSNAIIAEEREVSPQLKPGEYVALSISDTGVGIPAQHRDKIYDPFFTTKDAGKGSGLGLSQVQGFVRQSGGDVVIESAEGKGTRVTLYLPRAPAGNALAPTAQAPGYRSGA